MAQGRNCVRRSSKPTASRELPLRAKFLLGLRVDEPGPDATPCSVFRQRLLAHDQARAAFEAVLQAARDQGLLAAVDTALIDATAVTPAAAVPSLAGLVQQAIRRVLLAWRKPDPLTVQKVVHDQGWAPYVAPRCTPVGDGILTPAGRTAFDRAVADAEALLRRVPAPPDRSPALAAAVAVLERIGEERVDAGGQLRDQVATATDPDARWGAKGRNRHGTGYKATVVEDHATARVLNLPITPANVPDDQVLPAALEGVATAPVEALGDGAYGTRRNRRGCRDHRIRLVAPRKGQGRGRVIGRILQPADRARRAKGERKQAELVRWHGFRQARYIGRAKVQLQAYLTAAWANLKRLARLLRAPAPALAAA